jgi:cysteine synthase
MIGASRGYRVSLCVPSNVTEERKRLLRIYGAELVFTDPMDGSDGAIREARRRATSASHIATSIPIGTATRRTGARTTRRPASRSSNSAADG